jgi:tetratricopeptide (TPR) repeat protein
VTKPRVLLATLVATVLLLANIAFGQYSRAPFFEHTLEVSQAYGIQLSLQRLDALELVDEYAEADEDDDDDEEEEGLDDDYLEIVEGFESDLARYYGTLAAKDPELAEDVEEAIEALEEAIEEGEDYDDQLVTLRVLLTAAYDVVIPAELRDDPAFVAAVIVELSMGEGGVGEGYEEAVEGELGAYTMGYAALERVTGLWRQIAGGASEQQRADVEEMLEFLETVYPVPVIDEAIVGNPEEAEAPVQRMIGVLETVVDAELFPGRDLAALAAHLPAELAGYCELYEGGEDDLALEGVMAVGYLYLSADLGDFLGFMAPEVNEEIVELIVALTGLEPEEEGDDDDDDDDDDEEHEELADPGAACRELLEALREAHEVFGG